MLLVAAAAVAFFGFFLVTDGGPFDRGEDESWDEAAAEDGVSAGALADDGHGVEPVRSPVLFGRASALARTGKGHVVGRIRDFATRKPVAGAIVRLEGRGYAKETVATSVESGSDGRVHLPTVPAGEGYELAVLVDGIVVRRLPGLAVAADDATDLGTIWLGDAGTLIGRVVSAKGGAGLAGALVRVYPGGDALLKILDDRVGILSPIEWDVAPLAEGTTDANGRFAIEDIPPGPVTIAGCVAGFHRELRPATMTGDGVIGDEPVLRMEPTKPLEGRVVDRSGAGIEGAHVVISNALSYASALLRRLAVTDRDGTFRLESPPRGRWLSVVVAAEGYPTLEVEIGEERDGLVIVLGVGATLTLRFVHDEGGEPIPDASISAMLAASRSPGHEEARCLLTGVTDERGEVEFLATPGFIVWVFLAHPVVGGGVYEGRDVAPPGAAALKGPDVLQVLAGENRAELRKQSGVVVTGSVTDAAGEAIGGAAVRTDDVVMQLCGSGKAVTDADGRYRLAVSAKRTLTILVEVTGYVQVPPPTPFELDPRHPVEHDVVLLRAARVEGRAVGMNGTPARGVAVRLWPESDEDDVSTDPVGRTPVRGTTDNEGHYVFDTVAPNRTYFVAGRAKGFIASRSDAFEVAANAEVVEAPRLRMQTGLQVDVDVLDPSGQAVAGAWVNAYVEPAAGGAWTERRPTWRHHKSETDAHGRTTVTDVPPGKVTVKAGFEGFAPGRTTTAVSRASPPAGPVVVRLRPMRKVAGIVRGEDGEMVVGASVTAARAGATPPERSDTDANWVPSPHNETDAQGRFDVWGVPEGVPVALTVDAEGYEIRVFPLDGPTDRLDLEIRKVGPAVRQRLDEIQAEIKRIGERHQTTEDDAERQALEKQREALRRESTRIRGAED